MDLTAQFTQAVTLDRAGRRDEAQAAYLAILAAAPDHTGALNNLGALLLASGHRTAARTCYRQAAETHPEQAMGHINLGNLLLTDGDPTAARDAFSAALAADPDSADAHRGLALALTELGEMDAALAHRRSAYEGRAITTLPRRGTGPAINVLMLVAAAGGNVRNEMIVDDPSFAVTVAAPEFLDPDTALPAHDLVFNAIGDADLCADALAAAARLLAKRTAPLLNPPGLVFRTARDILAQRLADHPDIFAPKAMLLPREAISVEFLAEQGFRFPLLVRSPGFHTGRHFQRFDTPDALDITALPGDELIALEYLDACGPDGRHRKYRAMFVDGQIYPLHLALSTHWKVHYFTAAMRDQPEGRAEEAAYLADMAAVLGDRAMRGLAKVRDTLGLDYAGIDFAVAPDGRLLLFEANATMVVLPPDPDPIWDYRRSATKRVLDAVHAMLLSRARKSGGVR